MATITDLRKQDEGTCIGYGLGKDSMALRPRN